ncbi:MAG: 4'-phosphopantetheinyl transferase superfamily protein [Lachnospiraceae bacterium]|nr:4'-phosphopantetheinyl transferase superfamily protein [Lachnospiraceae bacterium]
MKIIAKEIKSGLSEEKYTRALESIKNADFDRYDRICKNKSEANRMRLLTAGMLIMEMCDRLGIDKPVIARDDHGKPYLKGHENVCFNLSHSGDYIALAYGDAPIGIDVQEVRNVSDSFIKRILNDSETELYDSTDMVTVCRIWTIKEAYSKLIGLGLSYDFRNCVIDTDNATIHDFTGIHPDASYRTHKIASSVYLTYEKYV